MDFAFTEEQEMLRSQARSFMADKFPAERVAELADSDNGWDEKSWREIAELGWTGLSVAEDHGGAGMGFVEEAVVFEVLGHALYPGPYFSSVALTLPALTGAPELLSRVVEGDAVTTLAWAEPGGCSSLGDIERVATVASPSAAGWKLSGTKHLVPDLGMASDLLVVARSDEGAGLWRVALDRETPARAVLPTMDSTRRLGRVDLSEQDAVLIVGSDGVGEVLERIRLRALAALALEAVGVAQRALELSIEHGGNRRQFDRPIGAYQAVSHQVVNSYVDTELARSLAYWAAWCVAEDVERAAVAAAAAKALAADAAVAACERAIQVHGGIGFTYEHVLHRYYRRAQWIDAFERFGAELRQQVAGAVLDDVDGGEEVASG